MTDDVRSGSSPNFCPPVEEGITFRFTDEKGDETDLEFLGLIISNGKSYGFFFPVDEDNPALSSGEIIVLEVTETDDEGQPEGFELIEDESEIVAAYDIFKDATRDIYRFE